MKRDTDKPNKNVISIMEKALNNVDPRLVGHGKRVAYLIYKVLRPRNLLNERELHDICALALLHDVGAYKTEEIDKMVVFETTDVWEHSIYGYMFLKYLSPLSYWAPIILHHHSDCEQVKMLENSQHQLLAQLINLCDRADVYSLQNDSNQSFIWHVNQSRSIEYSEEVVYMYLEANIDITNVFDEMLVDRRFDDFLYNTPLSMKVMKQYLQMTFYSIHFSNKFKVNHAYTSTLIPATFARVSNLSEAEFEKIIEDAFINELKEIDISKKFIRSAKKMDVGSIKINNENFLEDILMLVNLFDSFYGVKGYKDYCSKAVVDILADLIVRQGLKRNIVVLMTEYYEPMVDESKGVKVSPLEIYEAIERLPC